MIRFCLLRLFILLAFAALPAFAVEDESRATVAFSRSQ
jgi:hypothetical protein